MQYSVPGLNGLACSINHKGIHSFEHRISNIEPRFSWGVKLSDATEPENNIDHIGDRSGDGFGNYRRHQRRGQGGSAR